MNERDSARLRERVLGSLETARLETSPYHHWLLDDVLSAQACDAIVALPFPVPDIADTKGKRETHNESRSFFSVENQKRFGVCRDVARALQDEAIVRRLEEICEVRLGGGFLRIEYCQDTTGFWLEPHTDIGAKLFTMLVYLSTDPGTEDWGTDVYDAEMNLVGTAPCRLNAGLIFIPADDTWHGFRRRPISGVRRTLIVNYVKDEWRSRHELAFPDRPVG